MDKKDRKKLVRWFLRIAAKEVKRRDWLAAADAYWSAAFHQAVLNQARR